MDAAIEDVVRKCDVCQESRPSPPSAPLHPWEWPAELWSRLHLDFAGPFLKGMFLIVVDAHSKWLDVRPMSSITSSKTIEQLRSIFSVHGLPKKIVTDNGSSFTSAEFKEFMRENGITHITSAPYHPSSNGLAERAVQTFKFGIQRIPGATIQERLSKFLFKYRITPHSTTGIAPAELLMNCHLRSRLDLLYPDVSRKVEYEQGRQKRAHDNAKPLRTFTEGDSVYAEDFTASACKWIPGTVVGATGPLSYTIRLQSGAVVRRHVDNLRRRDSQSDPDESTSDGSGDPTGYSEGVVDWDLPIQPLLLCQILGTHLRNLSLWEVLLLYPPQEALQLELIHLLHLPLLYLHLRLPLRNLHQPLDNICASFYSSSGAY